VTPRILVVEDDPAVREMLKVALGEDGHRVATAGDGELALGECAIEEPGLILLDLDLPVMDGREFLARYRAGPRGQAKVAVVSGVADADIVARHLVADAFIGKPFDIEILLRAVQGLMPPTEQRGRL
jgi:DNA-binding response OmpR family regulator